MKNIDLNSLKWILFDFGGCLDCDGTHSRELFFNSFKKSKPFIDINWKHFQEGYTFSDNHVIQNGLIKNSSLEEMNFTMCKYICEHLSYPTDLATQPAKMITSEQSYYLNRNLKLIKELSVKYKLGIISNFSGNLNVILKDFSLANYFAFILDSFHVGTSKPSPKIFEMAIKKSETSPNNILYLGDNPIRDIVPAKKIGMNTGLMRNKNNKYINSEDYLDADIILYSLLELPSIIHNE